LSLHPSERICCEFGSPALISRPTCIAFDCEF
jgi:hypothetical protein